MTGFDLRLKTLGLIISALLALLAGRLWMLQLTQWVDYTGQALANRTSVVSTPAPRGLIYDREGRVLAENRPQWSITITPADLPEEQSDRDKIIKRLASILRERDVSTADVRQAIDTICEDVSVKPTPLGDFAVDVPLEVVAQVEERALELPGVGVEEGFRRSYPHGDLASHVLGYARAISEEQYSQWGDLQYPTDREPQGLGVEPWQDDPVYGPQSLFGQSGIEAACELDESTDPPTPVLHGRRGMRVYEVDVFNKPLRLIREERVPQQGAGVYLTLDLDVQRVAERALAQAVGATRTGAVVLMDVHTGEVLAMASKPSIDPNRWVKGFSDEEYQRLASDERHPFYNKAISGTYPPGSTFKMITALAALESTGLSPQQEFVCEGIIHEGADHQPFRCWRRSGHGRLNLWGAIGQSCDVYFYELVRKAGTTSDAIAKYARLFGLGESTRCGLPSEAPGLVPDREWKADVRDEDWYTGDTLQFAIGQSFLRVTPLQMAVMTAAIANGGTVISPHLVRKTVWPEYLNRGPTVFKAEVVRQVPVDPANLKIVQQGMRRAVVSRHGTAHALADSGLSLAGKTGSAQVYLDKKTHAWFVCYGPYDDPRFACSVLVTEGGHGSETAAPVALRVMKAAMLKYRHGNREALQALLEQAPAEKPAVQVQGD
ncbi:MAG: penicillin-binding protein 2 [Armatimonadota bacterium]|nr:penicillin-binding protein 2 [Armatimonadota bacterium]